MSLAPPALAGGFFTTSATWEAVAAGMSDRQSLNYVSVTELNNLECMFKFFVLQI